MAKSKKKEENIFSKILNNPKTILTILSIICVLLLVYSLSLKSTINKNGEILVGSIEEDEIYIPNIHYLTNSKMNYFYADQAMIKKNDKIYSYEIGYYVKDKDNNLIKLAERSGVLDDSVELDKVVSDLSAWNFGELESQNIFFTKENKKYLSNMYFIIKASTKKDVNTFDINLEYKVKVISLTKN